MGKAINEAYDKRLYSDYSIGFAITESKAEKQLKVAKEFVIELKEYLEKKIM